MPRPSEVQTTSAFSPHLSRLSLLRVTTACRTVGYASADGAAQELPADPNVPYSEGVLAQRREQAAAAIGPKGYQRVSGERRG